MRVSDLLLPEVREALATDPSAIHELIEELLPADSAEVFLALDEEDRGRFLRALPLGDQVTLLEELEAEQSAEVVEQIAPEVAARLVAEMSPDDRAGLFRELPEAVAQRLLSSMPSDDAQETKRLLFWPEGTAGSMMTTEYVALPVELSVALAIERIRHTAEEKETIYYAYALDPAGKLLGVVSLRELVTAKPDRLITDLLETDRLITVKATDDAREAARVISKYDLLAVPVVDDQDRLLGIVTVDDVVDLVEQEATEDVQRLAGVVPLEEGYFQSSFWRTVQSRAGWLIFLFFTQLLTGTVLRAYSDELERSLSLVFFIPLIVSAGGNTGSQSAGLLIRALALGEVVPQQAVRVAVRELLAGLVLGVILAGIGFVRAVLWPDVSSTEAAIVGSAVLFVVVFASVVGALMPIAIKAAGLDPAVSSAPLIATVVDVSGILIYMQLAAAVLS